MSEAVDLAPDEQQPQEELPPEVQAAIDAAENGEAPSIMAVANRYLIGRLGVSEPAPDGSRVLRLFSGNGATSIELNMSAELCAAAAEGLTAVEVITQEDEEEAEDAPGPAA